MSVKRNLPLAMGIAVLAGAAAAFGLWGEFENDKPAAVPKEWQAVNDYKRVWGGGSDEFGNKFCFQGDTKDVNGFLEKLGKQKSLITQVTLIPEKGEEGIGPQAARGSIECNWSVRISDWDPEAVVVRLSSKPKSGKHLAEVRVYVQGPVKVEDLKIPMSVDVKLDGRLVQLVKLHQERRAAATQHNRDVTTIPATDDKMRDNNEPRSLFMPADEKSESSDLFAPTQPAVTK